MISEQINNIYQNILPKQPVMLAQDEAIAYFERLMMNGNIITYVVDGELCGFLEYWRISPETLGKLIVGSPIPHDTDLLNGEICLISRMWITPTLRNAETFISMGREFLAKNVSATHYVALQGQKKHKPIQVYSRSEILKHYRIKE